MNIQKNQLFWGTCWVPEFWPISRSLLTDSLLPVGKPWKISTARFQILTPLPCSHGRRKGPLPRSRSAETVGARCAAWSCVPGPGSPGFQANSLSPIFIYRNSNCNKNAYYIYIYTKHKNNIHWPSRATSVLMNSVSSRVLVIPCLFHHMGANWRAQLFALHGLNAKLPPIVVVECI